MIYYTYFIILTERAGGSFPRDVQRQSRPPALPRAQSARVKFCISAVEARADYAAANEHEKTPMFTFFTTHY